MMAENYMLKETLSYPSLIREVIAPLRAQAQSVLSDEIIRNIDCIYIYGSGDSLNAAVWAAQSFRHILSTRCRRPGMQRRAWTGRAQRARLQSAFPTAAKRPEA